jgi:hypothetical protein
LPEKTPAGGSVARDGGERLIQLCASEAVNSPINATAHARHLELLPTKFEIGFILRGHVDRRAMSSATSSLACADNDPCIEPARLAVGPEQPVFNLGL